jgi:hypothetical protein
VIFIAFTVIIFSGVMESRYVLQTLGLTVSNQGFWKVLHSLATEVTLWMAALHIALHWRWIWNWIKKPFRLPKKARPVEIKLDPAAQPVALGDGLQSKLVE